MWEALVSSYGGPKSCHIFIGIMAEEGFEEGLGENDGIVL